MPETTRSEPLNTCVPGDVDASVAAIDGEDAISIVSRRKGRRSGVAMALADVCGETMVDVNGARAAHRRARESTPRFDSESSLVTRTSDQGALIIRLTDDGQPRARRTSCTGRAGRLYTENPLSWRRRSSPGPGNGRGPPPPTGRTHRREKTPGSAAVPTSKSKSSHTPSRRNLGRIAVALAVAADGCAESEPLRPTRRDARHLRAPVGRLSPATARRSRVASTLVHAHRRCREDTSEPLKAPVSGRRNGHVSRNSSGLRQT